MAAKKRGAVPKAQGIRYRTRPDGSVRGYEVRYRDKSTPDKNGDPIVRGKTFRTLEAAKAWQRENGFRIQEGSYIAPEREATTWKQVSEEWLAGHSVRIKPRTLNGYRCMLGIERERQNPDRVPRRERGAYFSSWDSRAVGSITRTDVRRIIEDVRDAGLKEETEHRIFNVANAVLNYAVQEGYIRSNPAAAVRKQLRSVKRKEFQARALSKDEAEHIIARLPEGRHRLFALLGFWTGLRAGELAGLRVQNVDRLRNHVRVMETVQDLNGVLSAGSTKSEAGHGRSVPVEASVMQQIGEYIDRNRLQPNEYLFAGPNAFFHYQNFRNRQWLPAVKAAGFWSEGKPTVRFHDLRHSRLSLWASEVPPHILKYWAGHADITTTFNVYIHVRQDSAEYDALVARLYGGDVAENVRELPTAGEA